MADTKTGEAAAAVVKKNTAEYSNRMKSKEILDLGVEKVALEEKLEKCKAANITASEACEEDRKEQLSEYKALNNTLNIRNDEYKESQL